MGVLAGKSLALLRPKLIAWELAPRADLKKKNRITTKKTNMITVGRNSSQLNPVSLFTVKSDGSTSPISTMSGTLR